MIMNVELTFNKIYVLKICFKIILNDNILANWLLGDLNLKVSKQIYIQLSISKLHCPYLVISNLLIMMHNVMCFQVLTPKTHMAMGTKHNAYLIKLQSHLMLGQCYVEVKKGKKNVVYRLKNLTNIKT
jgi:hypothetical protein